MIAPSFIIGLVHWAIGAPSARLPAHFAGCLRHSAEQANLSHALGVVKFDGTGLKFAKGLLRPSRQPACFRKSASEGATTYRELRQGGRSE
jgi:hypothetical protein